jgi:hypothetical protein
MKSKLLVVFGLAVTVLFANPSYVNTTSTTNLVLLETSQNCHYGQCKAIAKSTEKQCKHCVSNAGDLYCWQHKR